MIVQLESGTVVKHYVLDRLLGSGASGDVWKANDGSREVAIKFMNQQLLESDAVTKHRKRLAREITALSRLHHAHIPALYDYDVNFARPYLVMQYISSDEPYDRLIASGQMLAVKVKKRLENIRCIASALNAAHKLGIIHRDIKPANIDGIDVPYLLDFSVALESENVMHTQQYVGTGLYMPPADEPPDQLSDMYSFALVAYEILFGRHPIFTPETLGNTLIHTRILAADRLKNRTWYLPSSIPEGQLPGDLMGADVARLDIIFEMAFGPRHLRYGDPMKLATELQSAILTPANQPYLSNQTPSTFTPQPIQEADRFTVVEANKNHDASKIDPRATAANQRYKRFMIAIALLYIAITIIIVGILASMSST